MYLAINIKEGVLSLCLDSFFKMPVISVWMQANSPVFLTCTERFSRIQERQDIDCGVSLVFTQKFEDTDDTRRLYLSVAGCQLLRCGESRSNSVMVTSLSSNELSIKHLTSTGAVGNSDEVKVKCRGTWP